VVAIARKARAFMYLSRRAKGVYYLWYFSDDGKKHKLSTRCRKKGDALKFLVSFQKDQHERKLEAQRKRVSEYFSEFLSYAEGNLSRGTVKIYQATLRHFLEIIGNVPLLALSPQHFDMYKTRRLHALKRNNRGKVKPVTVNIELRALRACLNTAFRWKLIPNNPFAGQKLVPLSEELPLFFTKEDFQRLLGAIDEVWLKEVVIFATLTGLRRSELTNLRWQDVDLQRKIILIQSNPTFKTKHGKKRVLPLNDMAFRMLQAKYEKQDCENVFTLNGQKIFADWLTHAFKKAVIGAKLANDRLHFHSLRHTFASWLVQDGVSLYEVQRLLGHSSSKMTEIYSHLQPEQLHNVVNRISITLN
jgi:integrase